MTRTDWIITVIAFIAGMTVWVKVGAIGLLYAIAIWCAAAFLVALLWIIRR